MINIERFLVPYIPKGGRTFVDVGASVGYWSNPLLNTFKNVVAFEPNHSNFHLLNQDKPENFKSYQVALSNEKGEADLYLFEHANVSSLVFKTPDEHMKENNIANATGTARVDVDTLDNFDIKDVDFIKIDTEGAEVMVVEGALATIKKYRPDIIIETHKEGDFDIIKGMLEPLGYKIEKVYHAEFPESWIYRERNVYLVGKAR